MVALEEWLAAIEEDYQTFLTLPTPFTGNKYWRPAKPIEKWDNYSYQLLIDCQPCKAFKELREQIDADLDYFGVAAEYSGILREIEGQHEWARIQDYGTLVHDSNRVSRIENVNGKWNQVRILSGILQMFAHPFRNAKWARAGRKYTEFFASFCTSIFSLCKWVSGYEQEAKNYQHSKRERAIALKAQLNSTITFKPNTLPNDELISMPSPEGDLKNYTHYLDFMLHLEARARLLGQIVSLRFPVLAKRFSLLNCAPEIPITSWKELEDFPFSTLKDELRQVIAEAEKFRLKAAELKDRPDKSSLPNPTATFSPSLKQFSENLVGQFLTAAQTYPELHLVAVYGGSAFADWPEVPGREAGELHIGLWQQDWRDVLGINSNDVPPISAPWLAIEDQLWEAGFYSARKPKENETYQQLDKHVQNGLKEFERLAILAANHLGISPSLANDESAAALRVDRSNLFHRWLERLLSTPERYQQTERPNDFTIRRLTHDVFSASARIIEAADKAEPPNENSDDLEMPESKRKKQRKKARTRGDYQSVKLDERLLRDWKAAKNSGSQLIDFAKDKGMKLEELNRALDRVRRRNARNDK